MAHSSDLQDIARIEKGLLANRPSLESVTDMAWVWRFANGYTGRANSLQSLDIRDDRCFESRLNTHWERSRQRGILPRFRVTPLTPPKLVAHLLGQGFVEQGKTLVMVLDEVKQTSVLLGDASIEAYPVGDVNWQRDILRLENIASGDVGAFVQLLQKLPEISTGLSIRGADGKVFGAAYASCVDDLGSLFALSIEQNMRKKGYGRALGVRILNWLTDRGAKRVALQVVAQNGAAIALYRSLGFFEKYKYCYLVAKR